MIAMVPEQRFMGDDQIGAQFMGFTYDVGRGVDRCDDAGTFFIGRTVKDLVSGLVVIDLLAKPAAFAVILNALNNFTDQHNFLSLISVCVFAYGIGRIVFFFRVGLADLDEIEDVIAHMA